MVAGRRLDRLRRPGLTLVQGTDGLQACGDKFLLVGRGVKFRQAYAAIYPASIVLYAQPQQSAAKAIRDPRLQSGLTAAGHRVTIAEDEGSLTHALESDRVDLILTDAADADRILTASSVRAQALVPAQGEGAEIARRAGRSSLASRRPRSDAAPPHAPSSAMP
jgi:hypothetical protein